MAAQNHAPNSDLFDVYFRRADLDRDGRISGSEAVSFFQGSGLPQNVLAQIWTHADRNRIGFLGRAEFYNALKLVTVAQSKRELTSGMVEAALYGPASSQIPAPQINLAATAPPQINTGTGTGTGSPASQMGTSAPARSQNPGFSGAQVTPNSNLNQQYIPSQGSQLMRPPQAVPGYTSRPMQGVTGQGFPGGGGSVAGPHLPNSTGALAGITSQVSNRGVGPFPGQDGSGTTASGLAASRPPRPPASSGLVPSVSSAKDSKAPNVSGNGFASDSIFGADVFSAVQTQTKQDSSGPTFSTGSRPVSSAIVPSTSGGQTSVKPNPPDFVQSSVAMQPVGGQLQTTHSLMKQNQQSSTQSISTFSSAGVGAGHPVSGQSQISWPKITQSDIQKYTKVFVEVDTDRDGKITGEQARNLFLSWRLPREVLKQVWDLSDQDNDSMLSLKEFCTALYLMERYREGRPIPSVLPSSIMSDFPPAGQPTSGYSNSAWGPSSGWQQQQRVPGPAARHLTPAEEVRQSVPVASHEADDGMQMKQQKSKVPVLEKNLVDQLSKEEQESLNSKFHEATEAEKRVEELEKEILDSKEKIEFYRAKMQELVLYKSRCDNRLNEITERVSGDKHEVELLAKKYEEKCKQVGDVASKLTIEEATFRDIQERKMELYQAVVKMSQDGTADGILQVRADRIQSDLDELLKGLNDRCKKYGLRVKPTALVELPFGWQPGIQQGAADWDEDWDKFEDEGFSFVKELTQDVQNIIAPPKPKSTSTHEEKNSVESSKVASTSNADAEPEKPPNMDGQVHENGSASNQKEDDSVRSAPGSPFARTATESPPREFPDSHFVKSSDYDASPRTKQSDHGGAESLLSGDKSYDEPAWGTFDTNDDLDSIWGFNPLTTTEDNHERRIDPYSFESGELGLNPIRTGSPRADGFYPKRSPFFDDSVPSTPLFTSGNSPRYSLGGNSPRYSMGGNSPRYSMGSEYSFDNFSRFDSFNMRDSGLFQPGETLARFDSMRSAKDFDYGRETLTRFDSIRSTNNFDQGHGFPSFDDADPFGSGGPFRTSSEGQTSKKGSENWRAF